MTSPGSINLMDEFEEAFQACLLSLTKQEPNTGVNKEDIELEVQKTTNRFIDVARQMEAFFLRKRFLVSTLKPDMLIKDENQDLRMEIQRKENLLNKHYNRLEEWKACLSELEIASKTKGPGGFGDASTSSGLVGNLMVPGGVAAGGGVPVPGLVGANRPPMMPNMPPGAASMAGGGQMPSQHLQSQLQKMQAQQMRQRRPF